MRDIINVQKDEYGYSVYWGEHIRLDVGNGHRRIGKLMPYTSRSWRFIVSLMLLFNIPIIGDE